MDLSWRETTTTCQRGLTRRGLTLLPQPIDRKLESELGLGEVVTVVEPTPGEVDLDSTTQTTQARKILAKEGCSPLKSIQTVEK